MKVLVLLEKDVEGHITSVVGFVDGWRIGQAVDWVDQKPGQREYREIERLT